MTEEEFKLLRERLYLAQNGLELSLKSSPKLLDTYIEFADGHKLFPKEILSWLASVRSDCWKYGPARIQRRHIRGLVEKQPHD